MDLYILERLTILYAMFNFIGFLFYLLKGIHNPCAIHTQVSRQASVARILFAGFFQIFSTSINRILLDAQIKDTIQKNQLHQIHMTIHRTTQIQRPQHHNYQTYIKYIHYH